MDIHQKTEEIVKRLLSFKLEFDVSEYLSDRAQSNWRDFEAEQHVDYPIKGCGLIANAPALQKWDFKNETLLNFEEHLAPEETGSEIDSFPRSTVSIVYIYSLLEDYGNSVCDELNPGYRKTLRQAWHHGVYGSADITEPGIQDKMLQCFCRPFGFSSNHVPPNIISAFVALKKQRNKIIHELESGHDFEFYFRCVVAIVCCIYFSWSGANPVIRIYPWSDYEGKYQL